MGKQSLETAIDCRGWDNFKKKTISHPESPRPIKTTLGCTHVH